MRGDKRKVNVVKNKAGKLQGGGEEFGREDCLTCLLSSPLATVTGSAMC